MKRLTAGLHGRIAVVISIFATLIGLQTMADFGSTRQGTDTNAVLVIGIAVGGAIAILVMLALRLDHRYPHGSWTEAIVRLSVPVLVLLAGTSWIIDQGIFDGSDQAFVATLAVTAALVGLTWALVGRTPPANATATPGTTLAPDPATPQGDTATMTTAPMTLSTTANPIPPGPPQWPDAPPTEWAAPQPAAPHATTAEPTPAPTATPQRAKRSKIHRITSGLITFGWLPLGALVVFAVNWCPDEGTAGAVAVLSVIFVAVQLIGNAGAGWILDYRYANRGGALLCIGRSVLVAIALAVVLGVAFYLVAPDGQGQYCG